MPNPPDITLLYRTKYLPQNLPIKFIQTKNIFLVLQLLEKLAKFLLVLNFIEQKLFCQLPANKLLLQRKLILLHFSEYMFTNEIILSLSENLIFLEQLEVLNKMDHPHSLG